MTDIVKKILKISEIYNKKCAIFLKGPSNSTKKSIGP